MGRSATYNVLGYGKLRATRGGNLVEAIYPASSRLEMARQRIRAGRDGDRIVHWVAQTQTGVRMLGVDGEYDPMADEDVKLKVYTCAICQGRGCPGCEGTGIAEKDIVSKYRPWQVAEFRAAQLKG